MQLGDVEQLLEVFSDVGEPEGEGLLERLDEKAVVALRNMLPPGPACTGLVRKELARRLAMDCKRLESLWQLLMEQENTRHPFMKAAACLLAARIGDFNPPLDQLPAELLQEAGRFLDDPNSIGDFATEFFKRNLIPTEEPWPAKAAAGIFRELAERLGDDESAERLKLLVKAYGMDDSDAKTCGSLLRHLEDYMGEASGCEMEGLYLRLALRGGKCIERKVVCKLTLEDLNQASPSQLLTLARQLGQHGRPCDGAKVAFRAGQGFALAGAERESEDAFLAAFSLGHSDSDAAAAVVKLIAAGREEGRDVRQRCAVLEEKCQELQRQCDALRQKEYRCQQVQDAKAILWNLSAYSLRTLMPGGCRQSGMFRLLDSNVNAKLEIRVLQDSGEALERPGSGMAAVYLLVDQPVTVKLTMESAAKTKTAEVTYTEATFRASAQGRPRQIPANNGPVFMRVPISERSIKIRIHHIEPKDSHLRFQ